MMMDETNMDVKLMTTVVVVATLHAKSQKEQAANNGIHTLK